MLDVETFIRTVGVHPGENDQSLLACRSHYLAVQVAVAQERGAVMQRVLAWVVGDDTASIDDNALHAGAPPVLAPPLLIIAYWIYLGQIGLTPPICPPVPGCLLLSAHDRNSLRLNTTPCAPPSNAASTAAFTCSRLHWVNSDAILTSPPIPVTEEAFSFLRPGSIPRATGMSISMPG